METALIYLSGAVFGIFAYRTVTEIIREHRDAKRLKRMEEINGKMEKLFRNNADYCNGAVDAFLSGDMETAQKFIDACNEEADKIECLARQFQALEQGKKQV